jgi:Transaldolase/Fructose-6-phosphate aldolase
LFFELALEDLTQAADLFRPVNDTTGGLNGWLSLEVSPLLADDTAATVKAAHRNRSVVNPGSCTQAVLPGQIDPLKSETGLLSGTIGRTLERDLLAFDQMLKNASEAVR